jgi:GMP synthase (glutamine-hydrolysing)
MFNILVVEGNSLEIIERNRNENIALASTCYMNSLQLHVADANFEVAMPFAPDLQNATNAPEDYDAIALTGSGIPYKPDDAGAKPYMQYLEKVLASGKPIIGSCWGMQSVAVALGGTCQSNEKGTEAGIAKDIILTSKGQNHPAFEGFSKCFSSPCIHRDHVTRLPQGAVHLAGNEMSQFQAMSYNQNGIDYLGVQFHPELEVGYINRLLERRAIQATSETIVNIQPDADDATIHDAMERTRLFSNWLNYSLETKKAA